MNKINALFVLLILIIVLNFFFPSELHPLFLMISVYSIFLIYLSMNIEVVYLNKKLHVSRVSFLIAVFIIISFLTTSLTGVYLSRSRDYFYLLIGYMLIIFFIKAITISESKIWTGLNLLVLFASIVSLYALTQYFTDFFQLSQRLSEVNQIDPHLKDVINLRLDQKRVFAFFPFPTTLSAFLAMILPFNIGQLFKYKTPTARTLILLMLGLNVTALFLTKSYGGIITLAAVALIIGILFLTKKRENMLKSITAIALILVLIVGTVVLYSYIRGGLFEFQDAANPVVLRLANWKAATQIISDYPLLGVGLGNYATVFPQYYLPDIQPSQYAHNTYLQIASEVGIPLASIMLVLIIAWSVSTLKVWYRDDSAKDDDSRRLYLILLASSLAFLINNCFEINAYYASLGFLGFLTLGLLHKICTQSNSSPEGTLYWKKRTNNTNAIIIREKYGVIILIIAWFMATGILGQRFLGTIFYQSATYDYKSGRIISAETDLRLARFMDPLDSRYYQLDSLVKLRKANQVPSETRTGSAIRSAMHAVALNPRTPHLRNNLASILFQQSRYWNSIYQLYWANSLIPFGRKYRENLELFKKTLLKK